MNAPSLEQWRLFVQIADLGSLTLAAAARDVAQPALSRQLAAIERACGGRLFERGARGLRLNEAGQRLYPRVRDWLAQADRMLQDARGELRTPSGTVHLGVLASFSPRLATEVFTAVRQRFPGIVLRLSSGLSGALAERVAEGDVDLALLSTNAREHHSREIPIGTVAHVLVGPPGDPLTAAASVAFARLDGVPLVVPGRPYAFHNLLEHWAARRRIRLNVVAECDALDLQKQLIRTAGVHAIMAGSAVRAEVAAGMLQAAPVVAPALRRNIVLRVSALRPPTAACREVLRIVEQAATQVLREEAAGGAPATDDAC
ncbi:LysR family transcriptional regulator [Pseudorhodoferax sp.]|uniref:LysR family transcriptional regulator n=1 Tax=Pseudorhodoferax sp. TaxID=1993553 RepID=UPI0039E57050